MFLRFLGSAQEVGRSCIELRQGNKTLLLDCGINLGGKTPLERYPLLEENDIKRIDAVIICHSHLDHSGYLPFLVKKGFRGKVFITKPSRDIMHLLLSDSAKLMKLKKEPLFNEEDVKQTLKLVECLEFNEEKEILKGVKITFFPSGHILGSAMVLVKMDNSKLLYTSDLNLKESRVLNAAKAPEESIPLLIIESTYAGKNDVIPNLKTSSKLLADEIKEAIQKDAKVLIPVFAVGRGQDIMLSLENYIRSGYLPKLTVFVDGMLARANKIYRHNVSYMREEITKRILLADDDPFKSPFIQQPKTKSRIDVLKARNAIILSTSGMLTGGPVLTYLKEIAKNKENKLIFVGYQAEGTLGRQILEGAKEIEFTGREGKKEKLSLKCQVKKLPFSGHADFNDLISFIRKLNKVKHVYIVHGEKAKSIEFKKELEQKFKGIEITLPELKKVYAVKEFDERKRTARH